MRKKKYTAPQTELLTTKVEGALLRATYVTFRDPNSTTSDPNDTQRVEDNGDDDFEAGAKLHNYNAWDDEIDF